MIKNKIEPICLFAYQIAPEYIDKLTYGTRVLRRDTEYDSYALLSVGPDHFSHEKKYEYFLLKPPTWKVG